MWCELALWLWLGHKRGPRPVDVNTASFSQLDAVPYLTPEAARGIIGGRPFGSVDELLRVSGIGEKTLERMFAFFEASVRIRQRFHLMLNAELDAVDSTDPRSAYDRNLLSVGMSWSL